MKIELQSPKSVFCHMSCLGVVARWLLIAQIFVHRCTGRDGALEACLKATACRVCLAVAII